MQRRLAMMLLWCRWSAAAGCLAAQDLKPCPSCQAWMASHGLASTAALGTCWSHGVLAGVYHMQCACCGSWWGRGWLVVVVLSGGLVHLWVPVEPTLSPPLWDAAQGKMLLRVMWSHVVWWFAVAVPARLLLAGP